MVKSYHYPFLKIDEVNTMKGKKKILLIILGTLIFSSACSVEGGRRSTSSDDGYVSSSSSSLSFDNNYNSNDIINSSNSYNSTFIPNISSSENIFKLPQEAQEFVDLVNSITVDIYAGEAISNAFALFEALADWDYPEVLEAYDRLYSYEQEYLMLMSKQNKINLFLEKLVELEKEITLDDEYLIIRAEDSYAKLDEELKGDPLVIEGYEKLVQIRNTYDALVEQTRIELELQAAQDFVDYVNPLLSKETYGYDDYFSYLEALEQYRRLSDNAKTFDNVEESYNLLLGIKEKTGVKEANDYFKVELYHKNNDWENIFRFKPLNSKDKFSKDNSLIDFKVTRDGGTIVRNITYITRNGYPNGVESVNAYPYYDHYYGYYVVGFSTQETPVSGYTYEITFGIQTDKGQYYYFHLYYKAEQSYTSIDFDENEMERAFYPQKITEVFAEFDKDEYSGEKYQELKDVYNQGLEELKTTDDPHMLYLDIISRLQSVPKIYPNIETMSIKEVSSKEDQIKNIIDNNKGSRWQAETTNPGEYVVVDLGDEYNIGRILILWEAANAAEYVIEYSLDGETWEELLTYKDPSIGQHARTDSLIFDAVATKYIKITMNVPGTGWGYSIFELDVFQDLSIEDGANNE